MGQAQKPSGETFLSFFQLIIDEAAEIQITGQPRPGGEDGSINPCPVHAPDMFFKREQLVMIRIRRAAV